MLKLPFIRKKQTGFTLIELLVVVTIISILIAIGAVSYTTANQRARDAQRKSDLAKIADALETEFSDFHAYPVADGQGVHTPNALLMCFNTGHDPTNGDLSQYRFTYLARLTYNSQSSRQFACQDFYTGNINTYMREVPIDPLNTEDLISAHPIDDSYYYNYYSYNQAGALCSEFGSPVRCLLLFSSTDYKPVAYKYKLVAIMENRTNATNAPGDQTSLSVPGGICRKPGYCYVVSSPN